MHFDAGVFGRPDRAVCEPIEVEVPAELAVDAHEQIAVERRRHAKRIVVREDQFALGLDEIGADEQHVAAHEAGADLTEKRVGAGTVEVADIAAEKQREGASRPRFRGRRGQTGFVLRLIGGDVDVRQRRQHVARQRKRAGRDVHEPEIEMLRAAAPGVHECGELLPIAGTELDDRRQIRHAREDVTSVDGKQPQLGARHAVPRQAADGVEQRRPEIVVEVPRRQLPRLLLEVILHVARKLRDDGSLVRGPDDHRMHLNVA